MATLPNTAEIIIAALIMHDTIQNLCDGLLADTGQMTQPSASGGRRPIADLHIATLHRRLILLGSALNPIV